VIALSQRFTDRVDSLFKSQQNRAREKKNKNGRIIKKGYTLPFEKKQFTAWLVDKFHGEGGALQCPFCRRPIDAYICQLDHSTPLSRSGTPGLDNLEPVCAPCNDSKGKLTAEEFGFFLDKMAEMSMHFHSGIAVQNIMHRLESYSAMKATVNRHHAGRQKAAVIAVVDEDPDW
jgi:5-methylcytosine-specific restriction endonuclease McrA